MDIEASLPSKMQRDYDIASANAASTCAATEELVARYDEILSKFVALNRHRGIEGADVKQETYLRLIRALSKGMRICTTYVLRAARSALLDTLRMHRFDAVTIDVAAECEYNDGALMKFGLAVDGIDLHSDAVEWCLERVEGKRSREIFCLYLLGYTWNEIGRHLSLDSDTARVAFARAVSRLKTQYSAQPIAP